MQQIIKYILLGMGIKIGFNIVDNLSEITHLIMVKML